MLDKYTMIAGGLSLLGLGWLLARVETAVVRIVSRLMLAGIVGAFVVLVVTGLHHDAWSELHRWLSFQMTLLVWGWACFSLGAAWFQLRAMPVALLGRTGLLLACSGLVFLAGVTGFLGPTRNPGADEETYNRFVYLHEIVLPTLLCTCIGLFGWWNRHNS